jgi:predicted transcriptional regulator
MTDVLELETRKEIFSCIKKNPGVNLSFIAESLKMSTQLVDYHLLYLEHRELVTIEKEGGYKRCYVKDSVGVHDKRMLGVFRQQIPLQIVLFLLKHPYSRHRDLLKHFGMSSSRFSYHLRKLVKNGIIQISTFGDEAGYIVTNEKETISFLIRYKPSGIGKMVQDTWADFGPG